MFAWTDASPKAEGSIRVAHRWVEFVVAGGIEPQKAVRIERIWIWICFRIVENGPE